MHAWGEPKTSAVAASQAAPEDLAARNTSLGTLLIATLGAMGAVFVPLLRPITLQGSPVAVTLVLIATPVLCFMAYDVARRGATLMAATIALMATALGAVIMSYAATDLVPVASTFFMLTTVILLAGWLMPFEWAAVLGMVNVGAAVAVPSFAPQAGTTAVTIPYIFLLANAAFMVFSMMMVQRERTQTRLAIDELMAARREHKTIKADLEAQVASEHKLAETRQHMLAAASHELRTPITPLLIQISAFQRRHGGDLNADQAKGIDLLERNLRRLAHLVDDLLDIAKMENGQLRIHRANTDMADVVRQATRTFEQQSRDQKITLRFHHQGDTMILADQARLSQVVFNLLGNAIKFTPEGGQIDVRVVEHGSGVRMTIHDSGPGLCEEQIAKLFLPFSQVHDDPTKKGNGLGLYISQGIVQHHGGKIWVDSDGRGAGSEFGFWVPACPLPDLPEIHAPVPHPLARD